MLGARDPQQTKRRASIAIGVALVFAGAACSRRSAAPPAHVVARPLRVRDPPSGQHPVHVAGPDGLVGSQRVAVDHLALEQVGHRRQRDVRVRSNVDARPGRHVGRPHVVEKDERPDQPARC